MTWTRPRAETPALPIDALALLILHDYKAGDGWNWQNWMRGAEQQGTARDREIGRALSEGWSWLMTHGLVVRDPSKPSADAYVVSRLGEEALRYGVGKLAAAERLGMSLHPRIAQLVEQQFLLGEYDVAVFVAMREVEIRVRDLAGASDSDLGTKLIDKAFAPGIPGVLVAPAAARRCRSSAGCLINRPGSRRRLPSGRRDQALRRVSGAHASRLRTRILLIRKGLLPCLFDPVLGRPRRGSAISACCLATMYSPSRSCHPIWERRR